MDDSMDRRQSATAHRATAADAATGHWAARAAEPALSRDLLAVLDLFRNVEPSSEQERAARIRLQAAAMAMPEQVRRGIQGVAAHDTELLSQLYLALADWEDCDSSWNSFWVAELVRVFEDAERSEPEVRHRLLRPLRLLAGFLEEGEDNPLAQLLRPHLCARLDHPCAEIRRMAVELLGAFTFSDNEREVTRLIEVMDMDADAAVRREAFDCLDSIEALPEDARRSHVRAPARNGTP
jgi:hypothetical protein